MAGSDCGSGPHKQNSDGGGIGATGGGASGAGGEAGSGAVSGSAGRGGSSGACGGTAGSGFVAFSVDLARGPTRQFQPPMLPQRVSPYVYGINGFGSFLKQKTQWGLIRQGGDSFTVWNWAINYLNTGGDYCFWQGQASGGSAPAGAVTQNGDSISTAQAKGTAYLATVPIVDYVSAVFSNNTGVNNLCPVSASNCNGGTAPSTDVNSNDLDFASSNPASTAFVANWATKPGGALCTCVPGQACAGGCTIATAGPVYQDEFVSYLKANFGAAGLSPIFFDLDNEPNYWGGTHPEVWPSTGTPPCQASTVTYDDIVGRDKAFAAAIKGVWPATKVFGPVVAGDGMIYAHSYGSDAHYPAEFLDYYLGQMSAAATNAGRALLDVLDVHYYNTSSDPVQCLQNPRMFWDPNYTALSASATDAIDFGWPGLNSYFDVTWYPRKIIPRLLGKIATSYTASPAPGLSFSEYNSGCETRIEGAVAEADNLGIFGREGVFAATAWPLQSLTKNYLVAAFDAFRNYDGNGAVVGDTAVAATTSDIEKSSVYAFSSSNSTSATVHVVALNKTNASLPVSIDIANSAQLANATLYDLVAAQAAVVAVIGVPPAISCCAGSCTLYVTLPAMSVTTVVLR